MAELHQQSMAEAQFATPPRWTERTRWALLCDVFGGPAQFLDRAEHLLSLANGYIRPQRLRARLERLRELGHIDDIPSTAQLLVAGRDQMMLSASEETKVFYRCQGIPWYFHNLRRFIAGPATMLDPVGLFSPRDVIVHHLLQTFHRHPVYDLVLLRGFADGLEEMERQLDALLTGTHPHQRALTSLVEDGSYHARLFEDLRAFRANPYIEPRPIPYGLLEDPYLMLGTDQFKDLRGFAAYASRLTTTPVGAAIAWVQVAWNETLGSLLRLKVGPSRIRVDCCDASMVARHLE